MKIEFEIGISIENDTQYYATQSEYHVYPEHTTAVCDDRYVALRAHDTKEFAVFVFIKDKKNVTIDFGGATIVMHGKIQPFLIDGCQNVTIKNCNVRYNRPPYTETLITEATDEYVRLRLNENCPCHMEEGRLVPYGDGWENKRLNYDGSFYQVFDSKTGEGRGIGLGIMGKTVYTDPNRPFHPRHYVASADGDDIILKGKIPSYFKPDRVLIITHESRSISSVFVIDTQNITLENYRILTGWGMGFYAYRTHNITIDKLCMTHDDVSPCLIANAADGVHTFGTSGKFEIRNSIFEGMIDDAINIHSNFRTVEHVCENEIYSHLASCEKQAEDLYRVGDEIAVYNGSTMEESARYTILKIDVVADGLRKFTVDRPALPHTDGDLIENITANCDVLVENCVFGKANSHLRLQSRGEFVIKNCQTELPFDLTGDASYWFESSPVTDLTIENCTFVGERAQIRAKSEIMPTDKEPYYHRNIKVIGNTFDTDTPMECGYADGIVFKGNKNSKNVPMTLRLTNCGSVDADNCTVERKTETKEILKVN